MKNKILILFVCFIFLIFAAAAFQNFREKRNIQMQKSNIMEANKQSLISNIKAVKNTERFITLQELTDFEWDTVYQFGAFTYDDVCDKIVGKRLGVNYSYKDEKDSGCVLFTLNDEAVCYLGTEDNGVNISLFSGDYFENSVSYKYDDLKTLYVADDAYIRMPLNREQYIFKNENADFQYSRGTAYYLYGGYGSEFEIFMAEMIFPRGHLLDFEYEILSPDFFTVTPENYTPANIRYNNADVVVIDAAGTEIAFDTNYNNTALKINLYSSGESLDIMIDGNVCSCRQGYKSNGIYYYYAQTELSGTGAHKISFEGEEVYLKDLWCYDFIENVYNGKNYKK